MNQHDHIRKLFAIVLDACDSLEKALDGETLASVKDLKHSAKERVKTREALEFHLEQILSLEDWEDGKEPPGRVGSVKVTGRFLAFTPDGLKDMGVQEVAIQEHIPESWKDFTGLYKKGKGRAKVP